MIPSGPLQLTELLDDGLIVRRFFVKNEDVVYVKGIFEASEGLCAMYAESGGQLTIVAPVSRALELDVLLRDLALELGGVLDMCSIGSLGSPSPNKANAANASE